MFVHYKSLFFVQKKKFFSDTDSQNFAFSEILRLGIVLIFYGTDRAHLNAPVEMKI